ncbi:hypothetical protein ZWY2020_022575 [Hordeum vulgare]|nr:hypothetical protein ZWY2020_022575 [Hordeum vulgare]
MVVAAAAAVGKLPVLVVGVGVWGGVLPNSAGIICFAVLCCAGWFGAREGGNQETDAKPTTRADTSSISGHFFLWL